LTLLSKAVERISKQNTIQSQYNAANQTVLSEFK